MRNRRTKRRRLPLQKIDEATNNLINEYQAFLFSMGIRISRERVWQVLEKAYKLPYEVLIDLNKDGIIDQGQGRHISSKHGNQLMVIKGLGRFEVKAIGPQDNRGASIKFKPSQDMDREVREQIPVIEEELGNEWV